MKISLGISNFLEEISSLSHSLFSSISLHWSLRKVFLSFLAILLNSAFKWVYLSFLLCLSHLFWFLMDLVISKSICDQCAPCNSILPSESGMESFYLWPSSQVCSNWGSQEARCRSWLYSWELESLASRGRQRKNRVFSGDPASVITLYLSCAPVSISWLRVHLKYTGCCGLSGMHTNCDCSTPKSSFTVGTRRASCPLWTFHFRRVFGWMPTSKQADRLRVCTN